MAKQRRFEIALYHSLGNSEIASRILSWDCQTFSAFWDAVQKSLDVAQKGVNPRFQNGIKALCRKALDALLMCSN